MTQHRTALLSSSVFAVGMLGATLLGGCVPPGNGTGSSGGLTTGGGTTAAAGGGASGHEYFVTNVYPKLSVCVSCHATGVAGAPIYLANDAEGAYAKIKTKPELYTTNSALLSKGPHAGGSAPALTADQSTAIKAWLALEFGNGGGNTTTAAGGGGTGNDGKTASGQTMGDLVAEWGKCMHRGDWNNDGMKDWSLLQTIGYGPCVGCHELGNAGTYLSDDPDISFDNNRQVPYIYRLVIAKYSESGQLTGLQKSTRLLDKGKLTIGFNPKDPNYIHPSYAVPQALKTALTTFQTDTFGRIDENNTCTDPEN